MEQTITRLWNRDFSLLVIGQIISIFGNMILSFALPLYILDISGSAALYGLVMGLPYISLLIVSPIGGIMADRLRKQRIMFWLDAFTTIIIVLFLISRGFIGSAVPIVIIKLLALNAIQGMYIPAVQSSVPMLVSSDKLMSGNSAVGGVNLLSSMIGMAVAGILYARFGLLPILIGSAICFAITAVIDLFIRIPYKKQDDTGSIAQIIKSDLSETIRFAIKEKPILAKGALILFLLNLFLTSLLMVGLPVLITQHLELGMELVGVNQSIMMLGGLFGTITAGALGTRLTIIKAFFYMAISCVFIIPTGIIFLVDTPIMLSYIIITATGTISFFAIQLFSIAGITFIQGETRTELIGKVMSVLLMLPFLANALGMVLYGTLFEQFETMPWVVIFATAILSGAIAMFAQNYLKKSM
ncbi:MAG: MFS transporter [Defluviitaleaceae bacterium]|nr:MFS transporter [Defluviitaleaceae bacterium]